MTALDIPAYLARIHDQGPLEPTAETLRRLHLAHLLAVPFENLSIHWGEPIQLRDDALFEKVVARRRGGFCYELNGLFAALLRALGFDVALLSAQVMKASGVFGREGDHMALLVTLDQRWLVDVGFGDSFREPLRLDDRGDQEDGRHFYRIEDAPEGRLVLSRREEGGPWKAEYRFHLDPHAYADFAEMCHYHETSPESHFTQNRMCSLATPDGRITLSGRRLITTRDGERQERELAYESEVAEVLRERFGIARVGLLRQAFLDLLTLTLLDIRNASTDSQICFALSDHMHNVPGLLADFRPELLKFYWEVERPSFLGALEEIGRPAPLHYDKLWEVIESEYRRLCKPPTA